MRTPLAKLISLSMLLALIVPIVAATGQQTAREERENTSHQELQPGSAPEVATATDSAMDKLDPRLRDLAKRAAGPERQQADQQVFVDVIAREGSGHMIAKLFAKSIVRGLPRQAMFDTNGQLSTRRLEPNIEFVSGLLRADQLLKVASLPQVASVFKHGAEPPEPPRPEQAQERDLAALRERVRAMQAGTVSGTGANEPAQEVRPHDWFEATYVQWQQAWAAGYTGKGVDVAVLDSGIDFANPDLRGKQARVIDASSPYFYDAAYLAADYGLAVGQGIGLPVAFDAQSALRYMLDVRSLAGNWGFYINTSRKYFKAGFSPFIYIDGWRYRLPAEVIGAEVRIGWSADGSLRRLWGGAQIPILLANTGKVDLDRNGFFDDFDTVYTDLDNDRDFSNDKPAFLGNETMWWDGDSDGYADVSGGMVYFVADGVHAIPALDWLYGDIGANPIVPGKGDLVVLMVDDVTKIGAGHGTHVASNITNNSILNGGAPPIKPPYAGRGDGMVQAAARDARLVAMGNFYEGGSVLDWYLFALFSYNGQPDESIAPGADVDDPQIVNQSFGNSNYETGGLDIFSRFIAILNVFFNPYVLFTTSAGNSGPGQGTVSSPDPWTGMTIGASTQSAAPDAFDPFRTSGQALWGDMQPFSNNGPDARGTSGVELSGNGAWGAGNIPLNAVADGWNAWEIWGGTSRANPTVVGTLALAYQAWRERSGRWPLSFTEAKYLAMSAATYNYHTPSETGSGISHAGRLGLLAGGVHGIYAEPSLWNVGSYRGSDRQVSNFINIIPAGSTSQQSITLHNPSARDETISLRDARFREVGTPLTGQFTTIDQAKEEPAFGEPDYLIPIAPTAIPTSTDLMVVRATHSLSGLDPNGDFNYDSRWRLLVYDWTDLDNDNKLWSDVDGDGYVDDAELDFGEYNRYAYSYATGTAQEMRVQRPLERSHDGIFLGWEHRTAMQPPTTMIKYEVRFYDLQDWELLSLSDTTLDVPANDSATVEATFTAPPDAPKGFYEGYIFVDLPGSRPHVRFGHFLPDAEALDFYLDGSRVVANSRFGTIADYLAVDAGLHAFAVTRAGAPHQQAIISGTLRIAEGLQYTIGAAGTLATTDSTPARRVVFVDENYEASQAKLRINHSVANLGPVDVYLGGADSTDTSPGTRLVARLGFGRSSNYTFVPAGAYTFRVYPAGMNPAVILPIQVDRVRPTAGDTLNIHLIGDANTPSTISHARTTDQTQLAWAPHTLALPVTANVAGTATSPTALNIFGGNNQRSQHVYDNSYVHGIFNWTGNNSGDVRRFFLDVQSGVGGQAYLLAQTRWKDVRPTDIDTLILGPQPDPCTNWFETATCQAIGDMYDALFGPYTLEVVGTTGRFGSKPVWRFGTATGRTEDWSSTRAVDGLHQILNDNVLSSGARLNIPFTTTVGIASLSPTQLESPTGPYTFTVTFTSSLELPSGMAGLGFGMSRPIRAAAAWSANEAAAGYPPKTYDFTVNNAGVIDIVASSPDIADIDIGLYYDRNKDGRFDGSELIGSSAGATADESIYVKRPANGRYRLEIVNFSQVVGSASFQIMVPQGNQVEVVGLPTTPIAAGTPVTFQIRIKREPEFRANLIGLAFIGPRDAPTAIGVPLRLLGTEASHIRYLPTVGRRPAR